MDLVLMIYYSHLKNSSYLPRLLMQILSLYHDSNLFESNFIDSLKDPKAFSYSPLYINLLPLSFKELTSSLNNTTQAP